MVGILPAPFKCGSAEARIPHCWLVFKALSISWLVLFSASQSTQTKRANVLFLHPTDLKVRTLEDRWWFRFIFFRWQVEEGWWSGSLNGKSGLFPSNFVKELEAAGEETEANDTAADKPGKADGLSSISRYTADSEEATKGKLNHCGGTGMLLWVWHLEEMLPKKTMGLCSVWTDVKVCAAYRRKTLEGNSSGSWWKFTDCSSFRVNIKETKR